MNGRSSRRKGAAAERELFNLLNAKLGRIVFKRNLLQSRQGGADSDGDAPVAIEVKRQERLNLPAWLKQARDQAEKAGKTPVLAYRQSRDGWHILVDMNVDQFVEYVEWLRMAEFQDTRSGRAGQGREEQSNGNSNEDRQPAVSG